MAEEKDYKPIERQNRKFREETAAEPGIGARPDMVTDREKEDRGETARLDNERFLGITGLVISVLSLFVWPIVMGIIGGVVGYFAYRRGARALGMWAMGIALVSILGTMVLSPIFL